MSRNLNEVEWKGFKLSLLFDIYHGKRLTKENRTSGELALLTASENNQGVTAFINSDSMKKYKNCISIDMFGHSFFHNYICTGDDNIYFFINDNISINAKKFITICINKNSCKYSYGKQFRQGNADRDLVLLPINSKGEPDYEFMEEYIKEKEQKLKQEYKTYIQERIAKLQKKVDMENKEWKNFEIDKIFNIKSGKRLTKADMKDGKIPFISAAAENNGITNFIRNKNDSLDCNVLGVNYDGNGGMVISFYHPYNAIFSDSVKRFHLKNVNDDKYTLLFCKMSILMQRDKYRYGYKFNETRMKRQNIMLPIDSKSEPDYEFMHNYMLYLEQKKILEYLDYIK